MRSQLRVLRTLQFTAPVVLGGFVRCETSSASASAQGQPNNNTSSWRRRFTPTRFLPKFEIHDVHDDPARGSMTRVSVDGKQLLLTQYPQMGPRKSDPNDVTPQFDASRRISTRFRHVDMAAMVGVTTGRLQSHHVKNNAYDLVFETTNEGGYRISGKVRRSGPSGPLAEQEEWGVAFEGHFAVALKHFLDASLTESFGFQAYAISEAQRSMSDSNKDNGRRNKNNNNDRRRNQSVKQQTEGEEA